MDGRAGEVLKGYLKEASTRFKTDLKLDNKNICLFKKENCDLEFVIELHIASGMVFFYTIICKVPFDYPEKLFEKLLESNLYGIDNNQSIFGLDAKTQNIMLSYAVQLNKFDGGEFGNILMNFTRTADNARSRIENLLQQFSSSSHTEKPEHVKQLSIKA